MYEPAQKFLGCTVKKMQNEKKRKTFFRTEISKYCSQFMDFFGRFEENKHQLPYINSNCLQIDFFYGLLYFIRQNNRLLSNVSVTLGCVVSNVFFSFLFSLSFCTLFLSFLLRYNHLLNINKYSCHVSFPHYLCICVWLYYCILKKRKKNIKISFSQKYSLFFKQSVTKKSKNLCQKRVAQ